MDAAELARWTRFAGKGGIGKCSALQDCVAERSEDLMFLKDDEITVLMQLPDQEGWYLGYCEGVVGRFQSAHVQIHGKLKKPIMTKRSSSSASNRPSTLSKSPSPTVHFQPSELDSSASRVSLRSALRPTSSQFTTVASSSSSHYRDASQLSSEEETPAPPSISHSSSSTCVDSGLDTPSDSPAPRSRESRVLKPVGIPTTDNVRVRLSEINVSPGEERNEAWLRYSGRSSSSAYTSTGLPDSPADGSEPSTRISIAMSDGETGIGLSLLQGMVNGEDEDDSVSMMSGQTDTDTVEEVPAELEGKDFVTQPLPDASHSRDSSQHSLSSAGEWEGASDIYDDYRYSRFSMASKMSRFSQASMYTTGSDVPPIPHDRIPNIETTLPLNIKRRSAGSHYSQPSPMSPTAATRSDVMSLDTSQVAHVGLGGTSPALDLSAPRSSKDRPAPLKLTSSPLLHTDFRSPESPTSEVTDPSGSALHSPPLTALHVPTISGTASSLRQKFERDRPSPSPSPDPNDTVDDASHHGGQGIVVDDDEEDLPNQSNAEPNSPAAVHDSTSSPSASPETSPVALNRKSSLAEEQPVSKPGFDVKEHPSLSDAAQSSTAPQPQARPRPPTSQHDPSQFGASRTSLFMPHPNAPKPPASSSGPMYGRMPAQAQRVSNSLPTNSVIHTLHMAAAARYGPNGMPRRTTIYGMCKQDLVNSTGPVPILFSLEPLISVPVNRLDDSATRPMARRSATAISSPDASTSERVRATSSIAPPPGVKKGDDAVVASGNVIPRANFFPKTQTPRPRSRSFSGFDTPVAEITLSKEELSHGKDNRPVAISDGQSKTVSAPVASPLSSQKASAPRQPPTGRILAHGPSPLSLPYNNSVGPLSPSTPARASSFTSSSGAQVFVSSPLASSSANPSPGKGLRQVSSSSALRNQAPSSPLALNPPLSRAAPSNSATSPLNTHSPASSIPDAHVPTRHSSKMALLDHPPKTLSLVQPRRSGETDTSDAQPGLTSPLAGGPNAGPPLTAGRASLRSKISVSSMQTRNGNSSSPGPSTPVSENETVQVQDMDFELVRPVIPAMSSARTSEESVFSARESYSVPVTEGSNLLRADSPAASMLSGSMPRSPTAVSEASFSISQTASDSDQPSSMEAHRHRELKWMSIMATTPASQARKSKKVKKLLLEGVPSSVRSNVWQHLTDSKSRRMDGLYAQLGKRGRVPASNDIERDAMACFPDRPRLQNPQGPLVHLLQAYLTMVPDIQYRSGLALVAGHLLLQSIDEDAFWIFVSLMDVHLRPFFSSNAIQLEVDASLFSKVLEANDAPLAKRLFVDMGIAPLSICRPWFCSLFAAALPLECLYRVWDIFLYEGVVFLFRIGLAILSCCRPLLLECSSADSAFKLLLHPPPTSLSSSPEAFIGLAYSTKLKDDDVRKQRNKMEAQVKRQTQRINSNQGGPGSQIASISLPRTQVEQL